MSLPPALTLYRLAGRAVRPLAGAALAVRAHAGKEDRARLPERFGRASAPRPPGPLLWLHGASVGEAMVLLQVREALAARRGGLAFVITTGTRTSAALLARAAPPRTLHQFAPIDAIGPARRFIAHWRPDLAVFAESELWPNLLLTAADSGAPLALVNARMNAASLSAWARAPASAARLLSRFSVILAADQATAAGLSTLARTRVPAIGNLKLAAGAPTPDPALLAAWRAAAAGRPTWLAASTHKGEDEIVLAAHARLRETHPHALLVLAPRHPERGAGVAALAGGAPRRALGQAMAGDTSVYVLDTLGELGAAFALAPVTLMGGSLLPTLKGHNPVEPARASSAVLSGPYTESFADVFAQLESAQGMATVRDAEGIVAAVQALWSAAPARARMVAAATGALRGAEDALTQTVEALLALLPPESDAAA